MSLQTTLQSLKIYLFIFLISVIFALIMIPIWNIFQNYVAYNFIYSDQGSIVDTNSLSNPLFINSSSSSLYDSPNGNPIGLAYRIAVYPLQNTNGWTEIKLYGWVWNKDLRDQGASAVAQINIEFLAEADASKIADINAGTSIKKIYTNSKNSWSLCLLTAWVPTNNLQNKQPSLWEREVPLITFTTKEAGDVQGRVTVNQLGDSVLMLVSLITCFVMLCGTIVSTAFVKRRSSKVTNTITISGVTSSSINVQSPFANALIAMDEAGRKDAALALMQLKDLIAVTEFDEQKKKQAQELLETIADEGKKPEPRKFNVEYFSD